MNRGRNLIPCQGQPWLGCRAAGTGYSRTAALSVTPPLAALILLAEKRWDVQGCTGTDVEKSHIGHSSLQKYSEQESTGTSVNELSVWHLNIESPFWHLLWRANYMSGKREGPLPSCRKCIQYIRMDGERRRVLNDSKSQISLKLKSWMIPEMWVYTEYMDKLPCSGQEPYTTRSKVASLEVTGSLFNTTPNCKHTESRYWLGGSWTVSCKTKILFSIFSL